jgi:hypothetical protein
MVYATAMRMNSKLSNKYKEAELYKKSFQAYSYIKENQVIKSKKEVQQIKKQNGVNRGVQISKEFQERILKVKELIPLHVKPNGKPSVTAISKKLNISRVTITNILKVISMTLLLFWFKSSLLILDDNIVADGYTILPSATFTLFSNHHKKGVSKGYIFTKV